MILDKIVEDKKIRLVEHKARISEKEMISLADEALKNGIRPEGLFYNNLKKQGISIIAEFKRNTIIRRMRYHALRRKTTLSAISIT